MVDVEVCLLSSHYFIVVINASESNNLLPDSIEDDDLRPHSGPGDQYVAAVLLPNQYGGSYQLSSNGTTVFEGVTYTDVPLTVGEYRYFVRAYTIGPVCFVVYCVAANVCTLFFSRDCQPTVQHLLRS